MLRAAAKTELDRTLALDIVRATEAAAVGAAEWRGRGNEVAADEAAATAMYRELAVMPIDARVVVGEGEENETPLLYIGETVGAGGDGPEVDVAVDAVEGLTLCAKALPNALSVLVLAEHGALLKVPPIYMEKIAVGPSFPEGVVDLDLSPTENLNAVAAAKGVTVSELGVCILDRPRHLRLIEQVKAAGAKLHLIADGDIAGVIHVTEPRDTGIDIYMGIGGATEGVLAAAALACIGGQMQARLYASNEEQKVRARLAGFLNLQQKYSIADMVRGDLSFAATGITDGSLLEGVRFGKDAIFTNSVLMRASTRTVRWLKTEHTDRAKFA